MKKVLLASVLKPVTDPRMYGRIGRTLAGTGEYEVHIAGSASSAPGTKKIIFHPLYKSGRLSIARIFVPCRFFFLLLKLRPELVIVCTHELLLASVLYKRLSSAKIIYDIQENYYRNILWMGGWKPVLKHILAFWVRLKERLFFPFMDACFLAEEIYLVEMPFTEKKALVLENTFFPPENFKELLESRKKENGYPRLIMSGTIAEKYGVWEGLDFAGKFIAHLNRGGLTICGHVPDGRLYRKLKKLELPWLKLMISERPLPHATILEEISASHLALLPYPANKATAGKIPSKFFEYLAFEMPMLIQKNQVWENYLMKSGAALFIDFKDFNIAEVAGAWEKFIFYPEKCGEDIFWHKNGKKLVEFLKNQNLNNKHQANPK